MIASATTDLSPQSSGPGLSPNDIRAHPRQNDGPLNCSSMSEVTRILKQAQNGDTQAAGDLLSLVYEELRRLAAHKMAHEMPGQTLQPTALVHEAWLRLVGNSKPCWNSRGHFFAAAAEAMRRILVDGARRKRALKHGGGHVRIDVTSYELAAEVPDDRVVAVHQALDDLAKLDPRQAEVVKLRFFAGLQLEEIAELQGVSMKTVQRQWTHAKAWLCVRLQRDF